MRTVRRMVLDTLSDGESRSTDEVVAAVRTEDPRCRSRGYTYSVLRKLARDGDVAQEIREIPAKTAGCTPRAVAFWRLA